MEEMCANYLFLLSTTCTYCQEKSGSPGRRHIQHKLCADSLFVAYCGTELRIRITELQSDQGDII